MIPYSRPKLADLSTLSQSIYRLKTIPFTAAHTHIWQYPPGGICERKRMWASSAHSLTPKFSFLPLLTPAMQAITD